MDLLIYTSAGIYRVEFCDSRFGLFPYFLHSNTAPVVRRSNTGNTARYILITREKDPLYDSDIVGVKYLKGTRDTLECCCQRKKKSLLGNIVGISSSTSISSSSVLEAHGNTCQALGHTCLVIEVEAVC